MKKNITTKLAGGLGNQMFRYATGKALAQENNARLVLDISLLISNANNTGDYVPRAFELSKFPNIKEKVIDLKEQHIPLFWRTVKSKILAWRKPIPFYEENSYSYDPHLLQLKPPVVIHGDWQTELYFKKSEQQIRQSFIFPALQPDDFNLVIAEAIKEKDAVSIHVRRGDYLNKSIVTLNGICSKSYYVEAIAFIRQRIPNAFFYFFSDDPGWVEENLIDLTPDFLVVQGNNGINSWKDMCLMSTCKHNIIANSTFSWWGAWLNANPGKIVIAPLKWFATNDPYFDTTDLIPPSWHKI